MQMDEEYKHSSSILYFKYQFMTLEHVVNWHILNFPGTYRCKNHQDSRLKVLIYLFLANSSYMMHWHKNGYLFDLCNRIKRGRIPENFYDMELYEVDINPSLLKEAKHELKNNKIWFQVSQCLIGKTIIFNSNHDFALSFAIKYEREEEKQQRKNREEYPQYSNYVSKILDKIREARRNSELMLIPPITAYSRIVEMTQKRTNSLFSENFDLTDIREDWVAGAVESVHAALEYYNDESRYSTHIYHPNQCLWEFQGIYNQNPEKYRKQKLGHGMTPEMSIEEWCAFSWNKFRDAQMEYCTNFLDVYKLKS